MKRIIIIALLVLVAARSDAASISTTTCPGAGCVTIDIAGNGTLGIQITGTFVGTITFQSSVDNSTYVSLRAISVADTTNTIVTSTTTVGIFSANVAGMSSARVVFTSYTSGTATVSLRLSQRYSATANTGAGSTVTDASISSSDITTNNASASKHGWLPKWPNNTTTYLRGDGTYATPPTGAPGGSDTQVQFNDAGAFGGDAGFTWDKVAQQLRFRPSGNWLGA